ncbi:hypothetical protein PENSPDRAFT_685395 [Peniophora sp. CONT]|nr:hypothetical protein PENSPDRAFT_685395 [Peniophora sp. CONT]
MPLIRAPLALATIEMPPSSTPVDAHTVNLLLAPELIGTVIGWFLYGLLVLQIYQYRKESQRDPLVWGVFVLETILSAVATRVTYAILCESWGNTRALFVFTIADAFIPIISGLVSGWVQAFYAWRIYGLSNHTRPWTFVAILVLLLMLISSAAALYSGIKTAQLPDIPALENIRPILLLWLSSTFSCDTIIALSMVFILHRMRRLLAFADSVNSPFEARLKNIIIMSLETCLLTTASTIIMLAFFLTLPQSRLLPMMGSIISYLYSNSLLASLNSRPKVMNRSENASTSLLETFVAASSTGNRTISQASATTPVTVEIALSNGPRPARRASVQTKTG